MKATPCDSTPATQIAHTMKTKSFTSRLPKSLVLSLGISIAFSGLQAFASTITFDNELANGELGSATNWNPNSVPTTTDEALIPTTSNLTLSSNQTFGNLIFNPASSSSSNVTITNPIAAPVNTKAITLSGGGGSTAALAAGGTATDLILLGSNVQGNVVVEQNTSSSASTLGITLGSAGSINVVNSTANLILRGPFTSSSDLTKLGAGSLEISPRIGYFSGGNVYIKNGVLSLAGISTTPLGSATLHLGDSTGSNNATLSAITGISNSNPIIVEAGSTGLLTIAAASSPSGVSPGSVNLGSAITLNNSVTLTMARTSRTLTLSGTISGGGTITTTGINNTSVVKLSADNGTSFTGNTRIGVNTLEFSNNSLGNGVSGQGNGTITFTANGTLRWATGNTQDISSKILTSNSGVSAVLDTNGNNVTLATANGLTGAGGFSKAGNGTLTLAAANNYTGATAVTLGTLVINGSLSASSTVSVSATGILGGAGNGTSTGLIGGATTLSAGAKLSPGSDVGLAGKLTFSNGLNLSASSNDTGAYLFNLGSVAASDKITLTSVTANALNVGTLNTTDFTFATGVGFGAGTYVLFDANSTISGSAGAGVYDFGGGVTGTLSIDSINNDVLLNVVPEPATWALLAFSLTTVMILRRRRRDS
jgi:autotransporter-associated beta strand protein